MTTRDIPKDPAVRKAKLDQAMKHIEQFATPTYL